MTDKNTTTTVVSEELRAAYLATHFDVLDRLPSEAVFIASFSDEVENWTTWDLEAHVFISQIPDQENGYALLILSWDDNWGRWDWEVPIALKNQKDALTAKIHLLKAFVKERYEPSSDSDWNQFVKSLDPTE